ncbi:MAG: hypothetical protein P8164_08495 [Gammaproteobacteria bacterium]
MSRGPKVLTTTAAELERSALYSEELGIRLREKSDRECFKWFLASLLFGGRISETIAKHTYRAFERHGLLTPRKILAAGWDFLVNPIMREGGYVRYDGRKSTQILRDCERLVAEYGGRLTGVHDAAANAADLEDRLLAFYGVGPVTTNIFLRELRPYWKKADPAPLPVAYRVARQLKLDLDRYDRKTMRFIRLEAGLMHLRGQLRHRTPGQVGAA